MGLLTFYSERPYVFDAESMELGWIMATHTALAWNMLRHEQQFRSALASRDIIGQAKGMLMAAVRYRRGAGIRTAQAVIAELEYAAGSRGAPASRIPTSTPGPRRTRLRTATSPHRRHAGLDLPGSSASRYAARIVATLKPILGASPTAHTVLPEVVGEATPNARQRSDDSQPGHPVSVTTRALPPLGSCEATVRDRDRHRGAVGFEPQSRCALGMLQHVLYQRVDDHRDGWNERGL